MIANWTGGQTTRPIAAFTGGSEGAIPWLSNGFMFFTLQVLSALLSFREPLIVGWRGAQGRGDGEKEQ